MSNYNVLIGNRICRVLNSELKTYTWEVVHHKDVLTGSWLAQESTGFMAHIELPLNYFLTTYKSWIRNPLNASTHIEWNPNYKTEMEILRRDFLLNGWEA